MNAVIACGGTGGHLFPGLAVAEVLRERGHEVLLFISEKEIDSLAVSNRIGVSVREAADDRPAVAVLARDRALHAAVQREPVALSRQIYRKFKPDVVLGMGGFTSTAPILAGRLREIPTFIHESNAIPGQSESPDRADGARGAARLQGMRAILPEGAARKSPARRFALICAGSIGRQRGGISDCAKTCARCS